MIVIAQVRSPTGPARHGRRDARRGPAQSRWPHDNGLRPRGDVSHNRPVWRSHDRTVRQRPDLGQAIFS